MSPVGGVGINLAIQDALAAARILAPALRAGGVPSPALGRVQPRRWVPTALIQAVQRLAHRRILRPVLAAGEAGRQEHAAEPGHRGTGTPPRVPPG